MVHVPEQDYVFIADEAGISNDRYTVVGGLCMHRETLVTVCQTIAAYRVRYSMAAELKWQRVSNQKQAEYAALVDYFFALNNANHVHFHCITFDSHQWNHHRYNGGDGDIGLSKLYYQLLLHKFVKIYGNLGTLYVRLDHRNSQTPLEDIRRMLNATAARDHGIDSGPVKQLVSFDSRDCDLLQLNDVILGAVCAAKNGRHLIAGGRESKRAIAEMVLEKCGLQSLDADSPRGIDRFTVWNMRPRPR